MSDVKKDADLDVSEEELREEVEKEFEAYTRPFDEGTWVGRMAYAVGVALAFYHIWVNTFGRLDTLWLTAIHFAGFAFLCSLRYPSIRTTSASATKAVLAFDIMFGIVAAVSTVLLIDSQSAIYARGVRLGMYEYVLSIIVIGSAIELTRRATGWIIPIMIMIGLTYVSWWGPSAPGVFRFAGLGVDTLFFRSIFSDEGMFGSIALISATYVYLFILF